MNAEILVALLSFLGTLLGALGGIVASAKLTNYRISELEKKVDRHNNFAEKIPVMEQRISILEKYKSTQERIGLN
ncbi:MAG: hypothetical protein IJK26_00190 [Clostridia bacterium]|nr:hypothetical protein [Clostridia bacterium]HAQ64115.1 hypothetical protein [Oscillospiraceae bacterium]